MFGISSVTTLGGIKGILTRWGAGLYLELQRDSSGGWSCNRTALEGKGSRLVGRSGYPWSWDAVENGLCAGCSKPALLLERAVAAELCLVPLRECPSRAVSFFLCSAQLRRRSYFPQREAPVET